MIDLLSILAVPSPSGEETRLLDLVRERLGKKARRVWRDRIGNLFVQTGEPRSGIPQVLLAAHSDEVGFQIRYVHEGGFLFFRRIGGVRLDCLPGRRVKILGKKDVAGVICGPNPLDDSNGKDKDGPRIPRDESEYWIDTGCSSRDEVLENVQVGDTAVLDEQVCRLHGTVVAGRGMDNAIGVAVLIKTLEEICQMDLPALATSVFTVQEEVGLRGARVANEEIGADYAIVLDVVETSDQPDSKPKRQGLIKLGQGPVLNRGPNFDRKLTDSLISLAQDIEIPFQVSACPEVSSTDAGVLQVQRSGIPTVLIDVPLRYMHSGSELIDLRDAEAAIKLLLHFLKVFDRIS